MRFRMLALGSRVASAIVVAEGAAAAAPASVVAVSPSAIVPGAVNRTSLDLSATYDVRVKLSYGAGRISATSTMIVTNVSGGPIDRLELNTLAARLGRLRITSLTVDGIGHAADDQGPDGVRAARRHPPRRRDRDGADRLLGNRPAHDRRLRLAVHPCQRGHPAVPLAALDQCRPAVQPAQPRRSVRDGGEPVGPGPDHDRPGHAPGHERPADRHERPDLDLAGRERPRLRRRGQPVVDGPEREARRDAGPGLRLPRRQRTGDHEPRSPGTAAATRC